MEQTQTLLPVEHESKVITNIIPLRIEAKHKICEDCKKELPIEEFARKKTGDKISRDCRCHICRKIKNKKYRENMTDEQKEKKRQSSKLYRDNLPEEKKEEIKQKSKEYSANLPEWKKEENKSRREIRKNRARRLWNQYKLAEGCFHCNGDNLPNIEKQFAEAYDSHHVHLGDKKITKTGNTVDVSDMVNGGCPWDMIQEELKHCVTLCKTCHSLWHQKLLDVDFSKWKNYDSSKPLKF